MALPFVSIIVVNYNGRRYLEDCFSSLQRLDYPADRFEVIMVDNASADGSVALVKKRFPWVRIIENKSNLGFAGGNNIAISQSQGDYVALLNNDTKVDRAWLIELIKVCESDPTIGACTSKMLLFYNLLPLNICVDDVFRPGPSDERELGLQLYGVWVGGGDEQGKIEYLEGAYGPERAGEHSFRWTKGQAVLGIPVVCEEGDLSVSLKVAAPRPGSRPVRVTFRVDGQELDEWEIKGDKARIYQLVIPHALLKGAKRFVQNAGSIVFTDGSGRDRGTYVRDNQQCYEEDRGQYDRLEEVFAACGASVLYRRAMLEDVGLFDEDFFMYYEDTDLAWRARLRGWKIVYTPYSVVRHVHCGTATEWSPFFIYHVDRNRLAMLFKNGTRRQVMAAWGEYFAATALAGLRAVRSLIFHRGDLAPTLSYFWLQARVCANLTLSLPALWRKRRRVQRDRVVPQGEIERWLLPKASR